MKIYLLRILLSYIYLIQISDNYYSRLLKKSRLIFVVGCQTIYAGNMAFWDMKI